MISAVSISGARSFGPRMLPAASAVGPMTDDGTAGFQKFDLEKWAQPLGDLSLNVAN